MERPQVLRVARKTGIRIQAFHPQPIRGGRIEAPGDRLQVEDRAFLGRDVAERDERGDTRDDATTGDLRGYDAHVDRGGIASVLDGQRDQQLALLDGKASDRARC